AARRSEDADALNGAVRFVIDHAAADGVAGEEPDADAGLDRGPDVLEHLDGPVLIVADTEQTLGPQQALGIAMGIEVRDVGDVVAVLLQPERERKLPEEEIARAGR